MRMLALCSVSALGVALALNAADTSVAPVTQAQAQEEMPAEIIAAQIRTQGFECGKAQSASRDPAVSQPDEPVWILKCDNASYRVRLVGNLADHVEKLDRSAEHPKTAP